MVQIISLTVICYGMFVFCLTVACWFYPSLSVCRGLTQGQENNCHIHIFRVRSAALKFTFRGISLPSICRAVSFLSLSQRVQMNKWWSIFSQQPATSAHCSAVCRFHICTFYKISDINTFLAEQNQNNHTPTLDRLHSCGICITIQFTCCEQQLWLNLKSTLFLKIASISEALCFKWVGRSLVHFRSSWLVTFCFLMISASKKVCLIT